LDDVIDLSFRNQVLTRRMIGRAVWSHGQEIIRKSRHGDAKISTRIIRPPFGTQVASFATDYRQIAQHIGDIEPGRADEDVEIVGLARFGADARRKNALNAVSDKRHVLTRERVEPSIVQDDAL